MSDTIFDVDNYSTISPAAVEILNIADHKDTSVKDIANLLALDDVLLINAFKIVNSAAFALRRSPRTIEEAISYLGIYGLRDLIFLVASRNLFASTDNWHKSVFIANTSKKLAQRLGFKDKEISDIYIAALTHNIGEHSLKKLFKEKFIDQSDNEDLMDKLFKENAIYGMTSIDISCQILEGTGIPPKIINIIKNQKNNFIEGDYLIENIIIDFSHQLYFLDFTDQDEIDEVINLNKYYAFQLDKLNISVEYIKSLHRQSNELLNF